MKHGLPYVYNVDEASNFVPTAVSYYFTDSYNPHYFINPPAFSYLLHVVLGIWFGGGWPFGAGRRQRLRDRPDGGVRRRARHLGGARDGRRRRSST